MINNNIQKCIFIHFMLYCSLFEVCWIWKPPRYTVKNIYLSKDLVATINHRRSLYSICKCAGMFASVWIHLTAVCAWLVCQSIRHFFLHSFDLLLNISTSTLIISSILALPPPHPHIPSIPLIISQSTSAETWLLHQTETRSRRQFICIKRTSRQNIALSHTHTQTHINRNAQI